MRNGAKDAACLASSSEERKGKTKSCWSLNATKVHAENVRSIHRQLEKKNAAYITARLITISFVSVSRKLPTKHVACIYIVFSNLDFGSDYDQFCAFLQT